MEVAQTTENLIGQDESSGDSNLVESENELFVSQLVDKEDTEMDPQMQILAELFNKVLADKKPSHKLVHSKDLPTFRGEGHESAEDFLLKFERAGEANEWNEEDKVRHMYSCLEKTA